MSNITAFPPIGQPRVYPEYQPDTVAFHQTPHPEFPDLPCALWYVSPKDIETCMARIAADPCLRPVIPLRNPNGRRLSDIFNELKSAHAKKTFAERHGYPPFLHLANLQNATLASKTSAAA